MQIRLGLALVLCISVIGLAGTGGAEAQESTAIVPPGPTAVPELADPAPFFPGQEYDPAISTPESILGFPVGQRAASHAEIERCLKQWDEESTRLTLAEHAVTYEGRTLYHLITGRRPFEGETGLDTVRMKLHHDLPCPRREGVEVSDQCVQILKRMGARHPEDRYASFA